MKKNDILRVRVDVATLTALQQACADSRCSLSHILRESIVRELARRNGGPEGCDLNRNGESIAIAGLPLATTPPRSSPAASPALAQPSDRP